MMEGEGIMSNKEGAEYCRKNSAREKHTADSMIYTPDKKGNLYRHSAEGADDMPVSLLTTISQYGFHYKHVLPSINEHD